MTLSAWDLALYAGALFVLFLTPGPVWFAVLARSMSGGFSAAWPLALGVAVGDIVWPLLAILGMSWVAVAFEGAIDILRWIASAMFVVLGIVAIRHARREIDTDSRLTRPGMLAGFLAGVVAILGNPKAILFYMGMLPGFFDLGRVNAWDIVAIVILSVIVPLIGNLIFAVFVSRLRALITKPDNRARLSVGAGCLLICVGLIIPFV